MHESPLGVFMQLKKLTSLLSWLGMLVLSSARADGFLNSSPLTTLEHSAIWLMATPQNIMDFSGHLEGEYAHRAHVGFGKEELFKLLSYVDFNSLSRDLPETLLDEESHQALRETLQESLKHYFSSADVLKSFLGDGSVSLDLKYRLLNGLNLQTEENVVGVHSQIITDLEANRLVTPARNLPTKESAKEEPEENRILIPPKPHHAQDPPLEVRGGILTPTSEANDGLYLKNGLYRLDRRDWIELERRWQALSLEEQLEVAQLNLLVPDRQEELLRAAAEHKWTVDWKTSEAAQSLQGYSWELKEGALQLVQSEYSSHPLRVLNSLLGISLILKVPISKNNGQELSGPGLFYRIEKKPLASFCGSRLDSTADGSERIN
jgi:hypothetical protein